MRYAAVIIAAVLIMGCATLPPPVEDVCVTVQTGQTTERLCKSEAKNLPPDFPDELFIKWFSQPPSHFYKIHASEIIGMWMDNHGNPLAVIHLVILPDGYMRAWGFVEFNGHACIAWVGKDASLDQARRLETIVREYNKNNTI